MSSLASAALGILSEDLSLGRLPLESLYHIALSWEEGEFAALSCKLVGLGTQEVNSLVSEDLPQVLTVQVTWTHTGPCGAKGCCRHVQEGSLDPSWLWNCCRPHVSCSIA